MTLPGSRSIPPGPRCQRVRQPGLPPDVAEQSQEVQAKGFFHSTFGMSSCQQRVGHHFHLARTGELWDEPHLVFPWRADPLPSAPRSSRAHRFRGLLKRRERFKGKKVVAVVCGRNVDLEVFKRIIQ